MRSLVKKKVRLEDSLKQKLLVWGNRHDHCIWLDSNHYNQSHSNFQAVLAVDAFTAIKTDAFDAFLKLEEYQTITKDWLFGYLTYDLKNDVERLSSHNHDELNFPDLYFFQPKKLLLFSQDEVAFHYLNFVADEVEQDWKDIIAIAPLDAIDDEASAGIKIHLRTSKDHYFEKLGIMLEHIHQGDIYEANFCQEFYAEQVQLNPVDTFRHLNHLSKPPFATFLKMEHWYALSASPERYLKKTGDQVISQPIKGTAKRLLDSKEDKKMAEALAASEKERSENIMITDLVRNDLSRMAKKGSVTVDELCEIYSFEQVHHLISTIRCDLKPGVSVIDVIKNTFPMGSMTGAPKISAMKIIEQLEDAKRGLYSGAVGYFSPNNDCDFNVIIRSILYNEENQYVSYSVGGAITANSLPEKEYEECLIKAKAMRQVLEKGESH